MTKTASFAKAGRVPTAVESLGGDVTLPAQRHTTVPPRTPERVPFASAGERETFRASARGRVSAANEPVATFLAGGG